MKHHLLWTNVATATVSFALGWALTPKSSPSQGETANILRSGKTSSSNSTSSQADASEETIGRTRVAMRDEKKKSSEPRISLPVTTVAAMIRGEKVRYHFDFEVLQREMANSLNLLGTSEREKNDVLELLKKTKAEIYAEEKKQLKVVQTNDTEIRLDNQAMDAFSRTIAPKIHEGIRASLPADLAEILISATKWDRLYRTGEESFPTFTITRGFKGKMTAWVAQFSSKNGRGVDTKFVNDGTPIAADEVFQDERWRPFLKGLTLLPKDEE